jgi:hypothetical protein
MAFLFDECFRMIDPDVVELRDRSLFFSLCLTI